MLEHAQAFIGWVTAHPHATLALLFAVSMVDAIFIIGAFVPASIVLFAAGALVALGGVELWSTAAIAAVGAVCGDGLSFWLGRHYRERLFALSVLQRYPGSLARGRAFFARHGGKGVMFARFLGPVRAVTPAIAGASGMSWPLFLVADLVAAYIWALVYIVPGVVFGASLGLAAEVAGRLAMLLVLGAALVALLFWATRGVVGFLQRHAERALGLVLDWSRHSRRLGRFGSALADPEQPEMPALLAVALLLIALSALFMSVLGTRDYPLALDALVYRGLADLATPWGHALALALARLGDPEVYAPVALVTLLALTLRRKRHAAAHWLAALSLGALIALAFNALPSMPAPVEFYGGERGSWLPTRDIVMACCVYGFLPVLVATHRPLRIGQRGYALAAALLGLIALAKLYLGAVWASEVVFTTAVALLWLGALGLGYRRHQAERVYARSFALPVTLIFVLAVALSWTQLPATVSAPQAEARRALGADHWLAEGWQALPARRIDLTGEPGLHLNLQWAGDADAIAASLHAAGWRPAAPLSAMTALRWLSSSASLANLPMVPQLHQGEAPALSLRHSFADEDPAAAQWLLRLWPTQVAVDGGDPIWVGYVLRLEPRRRFLLLYYPTLISTSALPPLPEADLQRAAGQPLGAPWRMRARAATTGYTLDSPAVLPPPASPP